MIRRIAVVVPAADEEEDIAECLSALRLSRQELQWLRGGDVAVHVLVVLDRCRDRTPAIVAQFSEFQALTATARCVGAARQIGAQAALAAAGEAGGLWLASTDADSRVPRTWLTQIVMEARLGAEVILGTVQPEIGLPPGVDAAWCDRHHAREGHPHVHGANLALRADAYIALGGWNAMSSGEDVDLADRMAHRRVSRTAAMPVTTSVRRNARAPHGFSSYLRSLGRPARQSIGRPPVTATRAPDTKLASSDASMT